MTSVKLVNNTYVLVYVQELVYEMDMMERSGSRGSRAGVGDFLFEVLFQRCSSTVTSQSISTDVSLQRLLHAWNRYAVKYDKGGIAKEGAVKGWWGIAGTLVLWCVGSLRLLIRWIAVCVCVRVLLALPAVLLIKVNTDGGGTTLSCNKLIEHINQHQVSSSFNVSY